MTVAYLSDEFAGGMYPEDGGPGWELEGDFYETNPKYHVPAYAATMLTLFSACADGDGNLLILPEAGGLLDQAAIMVDALTYMSFTHREIVAYLKDEAARKSRG
jgi:hypothetical protein